MTDQTMSGGALRLTFSYDGDDVRLTSARRVDMTVPPSDPVVGYEGQTGFWIELQDANGRTVFRRILHDPLSTYVEVHSPSGGSIHGPVTGRSGVFETVVPASASASASGAVAVVFGVPAPGAGGPGPPPRRTSTPPSARTTWPAC